MARAKEIDFSSQAAYTNTISVENIESQIEVEEKDNVNGDNVFSDMIKDDNKEVIIVSKEKRLFRFNSFELFTKCWMQQLHQIKGN